MLRIAVCDEDRFITSEIESLLLEIAAIKALDVQVEVFLNGGELEECVNQGDIFDIIYLSVGMDKKKGIATAKNIRLHDHTAVIICVSGCNIAANVLLEAEPFRLLDKPINGILFQKYFLEAFYKILNSDAYFEFRFQRETIKVLFNQIRYFESIKRKISLFMEHDTYKFYGKLNEVENHINGSKFSFLRIHQSFLVNYKYIKKIGNNYVELTDGAMLHMSEDRQKCIRHKYCGPARREVLG